MLEELRGLENLGTPSLYYEFFNIIKRKELNWKTDSFQDYVYNKIIDNNRVFDGCLPLLKMVGAISLDKKNTISLNPEILPHLNSKSKLSAKLLKLALTKLTRDEEFHQIFNSKTLSYDVVNDLIQVDYAAFQFKYANFRQFLISFDLISFHPDHHIKKLIVNAKYKRLFDKLILPDLKKRRLSLEKLNKQLELNAICGIEAEKFVVKFEKNRLSPSNNSRKVKMISDYNVYAGYDIISFTTKSSASYDRFIEVKSYSDVPSFHWSRNEIDVAKIMNKQYFLYLVDRKQIADPNYVPYVLKNPYEKIINDSAEWKKTIKGYFVTKQ